MLISFFEEFPTPENLRKLKLVTWPTKLYLAAPSLQEFMRIKSGIRNKNVREFVYWPILQKKEGYWISPFSTRAALKRIFRELEGTKVPVMLDLELPTSRNPLLYLTQWGNFRKNKILISYFIQNYSGDIYTAEYFPKGSFGEAQLETLGVHYPVPKIKIIKMLYHSMHHSLSDGYLIRQLERGKKQWGKNFRVGYGTIAAGILGKESILAPEQLRHDLTLAQEKKIPEVVIFRLGGLNQEYANILKKII